MKISVKTVGHVDVSNYTSLHIAHDQADAFFSNQTFDSFLVEGSKLSKCTFSKIHSRQACFGAGLRQSVFEDCTFDNCRLTLTVAGRARLVRCKFIDCSLKEVIAPCLELVDCNFERTVINKAVFHGTVPADERATLGRNRNDFYGNDFSSAKLIDVGFNTGIEINRQILPSGDQYLYIADAAAAAAWLKKQPVPSDRKAAQLLKGFIWMMDHHIATGQKDQFLEGPFPDGLREAAATFGSFLA